MTWLWQRRGYDSLRTKEGWPCNRESFSEFNSHSTEVPTFPFLAFLVPGCNRQAQEINHRTTVGYSSPIDGTVSKQEINRPLTVPSLVEWYFVCPSLNPWTARRILHRRNKKERAVSPKVWHVIERLSHVHRKRIKVICPKGLLDVHTTFGIYFLGHQTVNWLLIVRDL